MSSKDQVFWAVNLAQLLELPIVLEPSQGYEVVVIRALPTDADQASGADGSDADEGLFLGLVVPKIRSSIRLLQDDIVSPITEVDASLHPYLSGQVVIDDEAILVLSAEAIGRAQALIPA